MICLAAAPAIATQTMGPIPQRAPVSVGYPTVAAALSDLKARKDVTISESDGWTVVSDAADGIVWSFAPQSHPAYPAVVKREIVQTGKSVSIGMSVLCEAAKGPCEELEQSFTRTNEQIRQRLTGG